METPTSTTIYSVVARTKLYHTPHHFTNNYA